ncbi:MAG: type II toxin-antitoxin system HicB family antitoxin [Desulfobacca sp.]|uniref:type II toxin-antitoxin system HicB family antitoxin n=1 Tax=Desulfobacca sp. TaxID=2067990 RepID=UPI00404AF805
MPNYIAVIQKEVGSDYGVSFPDFPGCVTAGATIDEAKDLAQEALLFHIEGMIADGETIPEPTRLEEIMSKPEYASGLAFLVQVPDTKVVRVNISMPEVALRKIDAAAKKRGLSRSAFLVQAATKAAEADV